MLLICQPFSENSFNVSHLDSYSCYSEIKYPYSNKALLYQDDWAKIHQDFLSVFYGKEASER